MFTSPTSPRVADPVDAAQPVVGTVLPPAPVSVGERDPQRGAEVEVPPDLVDLQVVLDRGRLAPGENRAQPYAPDSPRCDGPLSEPFNAGAVDRQVTAVLDRHVTLRSRLSAWVKVLVEHVLPVVARPDRDLGGVLASGIATGAPERSGGQRDAEECDCGGDRSPIEVIQGVEHAAIVGEHLGEVLD